MARNDAARARRRAQRETKQRLDSGAYKRSKAAEASKRESQRKNLRTYKEEKFRENMKKQLGDRPKYNPKAVEKNAKKMSDEQLARGTKADYDDLREWANEPADDDPLKYH